MLNDAWGVVTMQNAPELRNSEHPVPASSDGIKALLHSHILSVVFELPASESESVSAAVRPDNRYIEIHPH